MPQKKVIVRYKFAIASYKVRITIYKVTIETRNSDISRNCETKSELHNINSQLWEKSFIRSLCHAILTLFLRIAHLFLTVDFLTF